MEDKSNNDGKNILSEQEEHESTSSRQRSDDDYQLVDSQMIINNQHLVMQMPNLMPPHRTRGRKVPPRRRDPTRPFECRVCHRAFGRVDHLQRHIGVHLAEKPFECDFCHKSFSRKDNFKIHQETMHREPLGLPPKMPAGRKRLRTYGPPDTFQSIRMQRNLMPLPQQPSPTTSTLTLPHPFNQHPQQQHAESSSPGQRRSPRLNDNLSTSFDLFVDELYETDPMMSPLLHFSSTLNTSSILQQKDRSSNGDDNYGTTAKKRWDPSRKRRGQ